ncbi:hypothetical protein MGG_15908 [Pyricularia oryzae 70-15]|uniref:Uncharacterized protein n=4 Tax=Pyricularia oryzae TaxID=318829 RepID=G4MVF9_PYRO7|nr:uncharacterized protein MGG_15908 [Pyricularia oryzae 70-15]ELQ40122.1 hypothetical protein OOU_Y34scaffold00461g10 [Pyricularia oryzae Y34]KAI6322150.1 hypothetical protein MCOR34_002296 [Pyricularia oryzae]EHA55785.1 hypothetical protein MGG_15908 [Pyricularia oryzae 70-15]KAI7911252.1 hypothetical protein M9X92_010623 [Pyricularia oryzae]KAI7911967.1 hypothetical protein M0657_010676 [Pyricularia oryzae]
MKLYLLLFAALAAAQVSGGDYDCDATKAKCTSDCQAKGRTVSVNICEVFEAGSHRACSCGDKEKKPGGGKDGGK